MKIKYNSPVVLTFTLLASIVLLLDNIFGGVIFKAFTLYPHFDFSSPMSYIRLVSSVVGHANWSHLVGNFTFILLIGPILEEKYGSRNLVLMILLTAIITSVLHVLLFNGAGLGASGIVFMMVLLSSFVSFRSGTIPMTFILIVILFLGKEIYTALAVEDNISQFAHILGGICGMVFGFNLKSKSA